jgi:hypothetical protein
MKVYTKEFIVQKCIDIPELEVRSGHTYNILHDASRCEMQEYLELRSIWQDRYLVLTMVGHKGLMLDHTPNSSI